jgi:FMN phosphatase YigB (HAD superfamily)
MLANKVILVDCDGVLLNWEYAFQVWMEQQGYIFRNHANKMYKIGDQYGIDYNNAMKLVKQFNESAAIGFLPPLRDSMYYVKRLHEEYGYQFHVISSLSTDVNAYKLRKMNLHKLFGPTAFYDITCLPTGADKHEALEQYRNSGLYWIEDKPENADVGYEFGLKSILIEHGHNMYHKPEHYPVVQTWREAFEIITQ